MTQKPLSKKQGKLQKKASAANRHGKVVKNRKGNVAAVPKKASLKASFQEDKNLTSAINKKNEERTAARVANTGKVLRTVQQLPVKASAEQKKRAKAAK